MLWSSAEGKFGYSVCRLRASRNRDEVGNILNVCFLWSLKEKKPTKNKILQCLKETSSSLQVSYWVLTVIETLKGLGEALGQG